MAFLISLFSGGGMDVLPFLGDWQPPSEEVDEAPPPPPPHPPVHPSVSPEGEYMASSRCGIFGEMEIPVILLSLPEETMVLPVYFKMEGGVPCLGVESPDVSEPCVFNAWLGGKEARSCELQGFEDRLYCMFDMELGDAGLALDLELRLNDCPDPVFILSNVTIPEVIPAVVEKEESEEKCHKDLNKADCIAAGGRMYSGAAAAPYCICP